MTDRLYALADKSAQPLPPATITSGALGRPSELPAEEAGPDNDADDGRLTWYALLKISNVAEES
jgi:hypothetical protein